MEPLDVTTCTILSNPSPHSVPGPPAWHSDGRLPALHPEHLWSDPLPQDDLAGGNRRRHRDLYHRLHVLHHGERVTCFSHSVGVGVIKE